MLEIQTTPSILLQDPRQIGTVAPSPKVGKGQIDHKSSAMQKL